MIGEYGKSFYYQNIDKFAIPALSIFEKKIRTNEHFDFVTGLLLNLSLDSPSIVTYLSNVFIGIKQKNSFIINPIPAVLFANTKFVNLFENFFRFFAFAKGEDLVLWINNKNTTSDSLSVILFLENSKYDQIFQYDFDKFDLIDQNEYKLNINNKCKKINGLILYNESGLTGRLTLRDSSTFFFDKMSVVSLYGPVFTSSDKRFINVDVPVTELFINKDRTGTDDICFVYKYIEKDLPGIQTNTDKQIQ